MPNKKVSLLDRAKADLVTAKTMDICEKPINIAESRILKEAPAPASDIKNIC